jgi:hypothetical protein
MDVCCECYVLSGIGLYDKLITRPEESYRLWRVVVCDPETSWMRTAWPIGGCCARNKIKQVSIARKGIPQSKLRRLLWRVPSFPTLKTRNRLARYFSRFYFMHQRICFDIAVQQLRPFPSKYFSIYFQYLSFNSTLEKGAPRKCRYWHIIQEKTPK